MTLKGLRKAIERLPQQVLSKVKSGSGTSDPEFNELEANFKALEVHTQRLARDASAFKEAIFGLLSSVTGMSQFLAQVYGPVVPKIGSPDASTDSEQVYNMSSLSLNSGERIRLINDYKNAIQDLSSMVDRDVDIIDRRVIRPMEDILQAFKSVHKTITKRSHKLVDYDRHRDTVQKLQNIQQRDARDEKKLYQAEQNLNLATNDYNRYNMMLKKDLPLLLEYRQQWLVPAAQILYTFQTRFYAAVRDRLQRFVQGIDTRDEAVIAAYEAAVAPYKEQLMNLSILQMKPLDPKNPDLALQSPYVGPQSAATPFVPPSNAPAVPNYGPPKSAPVSPPSGSPFLEASAYGSSPAGPSHNLDGTNPPPPAYSTHPRPLSMDSGQAKPSYGSPAQHSHHSAYHSPASQASYQSSQGPTPPAGYGVPPKPQGLQLPAPMPMPQPQPVSPSPAAKTFVIAQFDFVAQADGDLAFKTGDRIEVIEKSNSMDDWWKGRLNGQEGVFPANYTQLE